MRCQVSECVGLPMGAVPFGSTAGPGNTAQQRQPQVLRNENLRREVPALAVTDFGLGGQAGPVAGNGGPESSHTRSCVAPGTDVLGAGAVGLRGGAQPVGPTAVHCFAVAEMGRRAGGRGRTLTGAGRTAAKISDIWKQAGLGLTSDAACVFPSESCFWRRSALTANRVRRETA